ncbi:hypothetical protein [uncultured Castellaniella sp.]|uniref:hypothetical protein n=1 Tax=uncultured Castellaniella sp. TaxID=647907 RepID=UPI00261C2DA1|nr:hypothetical protein [uncultured Castellaniella sp.]
MPDRHQTGMKASNPMENIPDYWRDHFREMEKLTKKGADEHLALRHVLLSLRDMPYARPVQGNTVRGCITEWTGTCSAKHMAAHEWLTLLGYHPIFWMACYAIDFKQPYFSDQLRAVAKGIEVYDVHNFLTCDLGHGEIIIDITFPAYLGRYGFPVTIDWNGTDDFTLCCNPQNRIALDSIDTADQRKRCWLRSLNTDETYQIREAAIQEMSRYAGHERP